MIRLGINIDHVATLRNARGGAHPCPVRAALMAAEAGADGITAHLREDRRHIKDRDMERLRAEVPLPLNFEMAATEEMLAIALKIQPHAVCLVPEKREELTTEGGLDVVRLEKTLIPFVHKLQGNGSRVSLFIDPDAAQVEAAKRSGARAVELHTGTYAQVVSGFRIQDSGSAISSPESRILNPESFLRAAATLAYSLNMEVHAGHGLDYENVGRVAAIAEIIELNIGHFLMGEAMFIGMKEAIAKMKRLMQESRA